MSDAKNDGSRARECCERYADLTVPELLEAIAGATMQLAQRQGIGTAISDVQALIDCLKPHAQREIN